jgi:hypothetical protein
MRCMPYNTRTVPAEVNIGTYHCRYWAGVRVDGCIRSKVSTFVSRRCDLMADSRAAIPVVLVSSRMCKDSLGSITAGRTGVYNAGTWLVKVASPLRVGYSCIPFVVTMHCSVFLRIPGPCNNGFRGPLLLLSASEKYLLRSD